MNRFEKLIRKNRQAEIKYLDGEFQVLSQGEYVLCALTKREIPLSELKYWSAVRQEAYFDAGVALKAYLQAGS